MYMHPKDITNTIFLRVVCAFAVLLVFVLRFCFCCTFFFFLGGVLFVSLLLPLITMMHVLIVNESLFVDRVAELIPPRPAFPKRTDSADKVGPKNGADKWCCHCRM